MGTANDHLLLKAVLAAVLLACLTRAQTNITCEQRQSCHSGLDQTSLAMNCGCDRSCLAVGDCCYDYNYEAITADPPVQPECVYLPLIKGTYGIDIPIVRQCPSGFKGEYVRSRCETVKENLPFSAGKIANDVLFFVPVMGDVNKLLYMNIYCALCNGVKATTFLDVDVRSRHPMSIAKFLGIDDHSGFERVFPRSIVVMSHEAYERRPCRKAVDQCGGSWSDVDMKTKCLHGSTSYVYGRQDARIYRNIQCALCNSVLQDDVTCEDPRQYLNQGPGMILFPYSLLFDLNTGIVVAREVRSEDISKVSNIHEKTLQCTNQQLFDPFTQRCKELFCSKGASLINGTCQEGFETPSILGALAQDSEPWINVSDANDNGYSCSGLLKLSLLNRTMVDKLGLARLQDVNTCMPANASRNITVKSLSVNHMVDVRLGDVANYLTIILNVTSIVGLTVHIVVYAVFPSLRNTPGKCLMSLSTSLLTSNLLFTLALGLTYMKMVCFAVALTIHYSLLAYFSWMSVLSFDIWHTFQTHAHGVATANNDNTRTFIYYCLFAFGFPLVIVSMSVIFEWLNFDVRPHYAENVCWFGQSRALLYFFAIPVAVTIAINAVFLLVTIYNIVTASRTSQMARAHRSRKERHRFFLYVKLAFVMGVTWVMAFVAMATGREELWYVFIILNSLQGVWIFVSFVCTHKVFRLAGEACGHKTGTTHFSSRFSSRSKTSSSGTKQTAEHHNVVMNNEKLTRLTETDKLRKTMPSKR